MLGWTHDSRERGHALSVRPVRTSTRNKWMLMGQQAHEIVQQVAFAIARTGRHSMLKKKKNLTKDAVTCTLSCMDVQINTRCLLQTVWSPSFLKNWHIADRERQPDKYAVEWYLIYPYKNILNLNGKSSLTHNSLHAKSLEDRYQLVIVFLRFSKSTNVSRTSAKLSQRTK